MLDFCGITLQNLAGTPMMDGRFVDEHGSDRSSDHDLLIELSTDMKHVRERLNEFLPIVTRLDKEAVTRPALSRVLSVFAAFIAATAATFGLYVHR